MARPSDFSQEVADDICERIASTARGLDWICDNDEELPSARTVHRWLGAHDEFRQSYLRARERQADLLFDECLEIADDASMDTKKVGRDGDQREVADTEWISRSKLRVETRMRMAGKLAPKKYGEKIAHVGGDEGDAPIQTRSSVDLSGLSADQLRALASIKLPADT